MKKSALRFSVSFLIFLAVAMSMNAYCMIRPSSLHGHQHYGNPPYPLMERSLPAEWRIDTAVVFANTDSTTRFSYTYYPNAKMSAIVREKLINGSWINSNRDIYTYDSLWRLSTYLVLDWNGTAWDTSWRSTETYDQAGNRISTLWENWVAGGWVNTWRATDTYDPHGDLMVELMEQYSSGWVNKWRDTYTYDSQFNKATYLWEDWVSGVWQNNQNAAYAYDQNNNNISQVWQQWESNAWVNSWKYTFAYNSAGDVTSDLWQDWDGANWADVRRYTMSYDASKNRIAETGELWNVSAWVNLEKFEFTFTPEGNPETGDYFRWTGTEWAQDRDSGIFMGYDANGDPLAYTGYRVLAHYSSFLDIPVVAVVAGISLNCFPNPAGSSATVSINIRNKMNVDLSLLDAMGAPVMKIFSGVLEKGKYTFPVSVSQLAPASYYLRAVSSGNLITRKIIVAK
jgi:hypothetical protein